jgi:hypothetical protein
MSQVVSTAREPGRYLTFGIDVAEFHELTANGTSAKFAEAALSSADSRTRHDANALCCKSCRWLDCTIMARDSHRPLCVLNRRQLGTIASQSVAAFIILAPFALYR